MSAVISGRPARLEVDLAALRHNVAAFCAHVAPAQVMAVVKAEGYGIGAIPAAYTALMAGASSLAVATIDEAVILRQTGIAAPILNLGWTAPEQIEQALRYNVQMAVFDYENAALISTLAVKRNKSAAIHIKVDSGMARLGFSAQPPALAEVKRVFALPGLRVEGVFSHFASADDPNLSYAEEQLRRFSSFTAALREQGLRVPLRHMANSPAAVIFPPSWLDMVRPGVMLYGCCPAEHLRNLLPLKQVMRVVARIAQIHTLAIGDYVGYSYRWQAKRESRIATLPLGYADGVPRLAGNRAQVLVNGQRAPMVGSVCMDQLMVDVTDIADVQVGDEAVILGQQGAEIITYEELAAHADTICDEVCTRFGQRLPKLYLNE